MTGQQQLKPFPTLALSVRQPWAYAIIYLGKDIENRSWNPRVNALMRSALAHRGRTAIHAATGMTRKEYEAAAEFIRRLGHVCPAPHLLQRGGIIGTVDIVGVVKEAMSPWFMGPRGLVLKDPEACDFIPCRGALGYFAHGPVDPAYPPEPAAWMLPKPPPAAPQPTREPAQDLFDQQQGTAHEQV